MKQKNFLRCIITISLLLLAGGCEKIPTNANAAFRNYTLELFREDLSSNTLNLHFTLQDPSAYGIKEGPVTLGTFSTNPDSFLAFYENCEASLNKFSYQSLSEENQLTYDVLSTYIDIEKTGADFCLYAEPLSPITGIHTTLPVLLSEYPLYTVEDVQTYLNLLKTLPDYFLSLTQFEQAKSAAGLFMCDKVLDHVLAECQAFVDMADQNYMCDTFIERLSTIPDLEETARINVIAEHKAILNEYIYPAYTSLIRSLTSLRGTGINDQGLCYYPDGKDYFSYLLHSEVGTSKSALEIKTMIENQITEDLLQIVSMPEPSSLKIESLSPLHTIQQLKEGILSAFPKSVPAAIEVKYVPKALEEHLSPAFYFIPAIDNMNDNVIYINQGYDLDSLNLFSTLAHEGYPGHLYQTTYFAATNPDPLRHLFSFKGYVEGWATYAEMCSYSIAPTDHISAMYEQKNNSLLLGLYALADLGIHYEGWTLEETSQFFSKYGISDPSVLTDIYNHILGDPVNYLSYYVGYLEILELKQNSSFTQKEFHEKILTIGPAPFTIVKKWLSH